MTKPVTSLVLDIKSDLTVELSAASWSDGGHLWAIERRPVSIKQLREVAKILGPDAVSGVEARLAGERQRLVEQARRLEDAVHRAEAAREAVRKFDATTTPVGKQFSAGGYLAPEGSKPVPIDTHKAFADEIKKASEPEHKHPAGSTFYRNMPPSGGFIWCSRCSLYVV